MKALLGCFRLTAAAFLFLLWGSLFGQAQQESILYNFTGGIDGSVPSAVIRDSSTGVFYGTAFVGGCGGAGTVYKVSPAGQLTVIHCFADQSPYGGVPGSALVRDGSGTLYGTTTEGGRFDACPDFGCGTVFKVNPDPPYHFTVLHKFSGLSNDGRTPNAILIDNSGNLFGTAVGGGTFGCGIAYEVDTAGKFSVLYNFTCGADGGQPSGGLTQDAGGNLYGLTRYGGTFNAGVVFKITGHSETVLYTFSGGSDGGFQEDEDGHPILDPAGNLYGTTSFAGTFNRNCANGCGVVFELSPSGVYTVLHSFTGGPDGYSPRQSLLRTSSGTIYGTSISVLFKLTPSGGFTALHEFAGGSTDGTSPNGSLVLDRGILYGSTRAGGTGCCSGVGVIFKISN